MLYLTRFATYIYGGMGVFGPLMASESASRHSRHTSVARRSHEIGVRMAFGATRVNILLLVLREGGAIVLTGTMGLGIGLAATRALAVC